jgi:hypothetical protein
MASGASLDGGHHVIPILLLFWISVWGLADEGVEYLKEEYGVPKVYVFVGLFLIAMYFIAVSPEILRRF